VGLGGDVRARTTKEGVTPLHMAALGRYVETTVRVLVELGSEVNARNPMGRTALHVAAQKGFLETIGVSGWLHVAAQKGFLGDARTGK
jgi:ankyrin repeat protein